MCRKVLLLLSHRVERLVNFFIFTIMRKYFLRKRITTVISVLTVFSLLFVSCTNLLEGLGISEIEDHWQFDRFDEEDRELIKGTWVLKKMGFQSWNEVDNPYVDTEGISQNSHIESLHIDFEGEHLLLTFNFNQPTLVHYRNITPDSESIQNIDRWQTSLTILDGVVSASFGWENSSTVSGSDYDYDGESFTMFDAGEEEGRCICGDWYFYCLYDVKNIITDEKGEIKRLILENYPSSSYYSYEYEFERE